MRSMQPGEEGSLLGVHIGSLERWDGGGEQECRQVNVQPDINGSKGQKWDGIKTASTGSSVISKFSLARLVRVT